MRANEREAFIRAMRETRDKHAFERLEEIAIAAYRDQRKKRRDRESDHRTRTLVGLRVPQMLARMWKDSAEEQGKSLYRFAVDALNAQAFPPGVTDCPVEGTSGRER